MIRIATPPQPTEPEPPRVPHAAPRMRSLVDRLVSSRVAVRASQQLGPVVAAVTTIMMAAG